MNIFVYIWKACKHNCIWFTSSRNGRLLKTSFSFPIFFKQYSFMTFTIIIRLAPSPKLKLDCAYLGQKEPNLTNKDLRELTEPNLCEVKKCTSMACFFKKEWFEVKIKLVHILNCMFVNCMNGQKIRKWCLSSLIIILEMFCQN